jgi:hypothetical protein
MNKNYLVIGGISLLVGFLLSYFIFKKEPEIIKVPVTIDVPVLRIKDSFPYERIIVKPYPVENPLNKELAQELKKSKSQLDSLKILKNFVKPKLYTKNFTDKIQSIDVSMISSGSVDEVKVNYNIFPKTITVDTILNIPVPKKAELYIGVQANSKIDFIKPSFAPGAIFVNKAHNKTYTGGYDFNNKTVQVGLYFRL